MTKKPNQPKESDLIRLNKYIADSGFCSRRKADELILSGSVSVDNFIVKELGTKVSKNSIIRINGKTLKISTFVYIALNKPKNCISSTWDPENRKTVLDFIVPKPEQRIFPVGRLDRNTTGIILLTNDGPLTNKLIHPSFNLQKTYFIKIDRPLSPKDQKQLLNGIDLEDGFFSIDSIEFSEKLRQSFFVTIHSGRNRILRRSFEALEYNVKYLDRINFAGISKQGLKPGEWRYLTQNEVNYLQNLA